MKFELLCFFLHLSIYSINVKNKTIDVLSLYDKLVEVCVALIILLNIMAYNTTTYKYFDQFILTL